MKDEIEKFTGERIVWAHSLDHVKEFKMTIEWYLEAMKYAQNRRVMDAACGTGFGTFLLSTVANEVVGVDVVDLGNSWDLIKAASPIGEELKFVTADFEKEKADWPVDLVVSVETLEHLDNPDFFLENLRSPALFFTIPCYGDRNPFHKIQYDEAKAADLVKRHFPILEYRMEHRRMIGYAQRKI